MENSSNGGYRFLSWIAMIFIGILAANIIGLFPLMLSSIVAGFISSEIITYIVIFIAYAVSLIGIFIYYPKIVIHISDNICNSRKGTRYIILSVIIMLSAIYNLKIINAETGLTIGTSMGCIYNALAGLSLLLTSKGVIHKGFYTPASVEKDDNSPVIINQEPIEASAGQYYNGAEGSPAAEQSATNVSPFNVNSNYEQLGLNMEPKEPELQAILGPEKRKKGLSIEKMIIGVLVITNIITLALAVNNYEVNNKNIAIYEEEKSNNAKLTQEAYYAYSIYSYSDIIKGYTLFYNYTTYYEFLDYISTVEDLIEMAESMFKEIEVNQISELYALVASARELNNSCKSYCEALNDYYIYGDYFYLDRSNALIDSIIKYSDEITNNCDSIFIQFQPESI